MSKIINIGALPLYSSIEEQQHRKPYAFGKMWPLVSPRGIHPAFQFIIPKKIDNSKIQDANVYRITETGEVIRKLSFFGLLYNYVKIQSFDEYTVVHTIPELNTKNWHEQNGYLNQGYFYLELKITDDDVYYSDVWASCIDTQRCVILKYTNTYNFQIKGYSILFGSDIFESVIYLNTGLGRPEYEFEEEATNRLGYEYIESQVSKKVYRFNFIAPEYLLDAMRLIRLCDSKTCIYENETYDMLNFNIEPRWEEQGDLASVEASFETDNIITNIGGFAS